MVAAETYMVVFRIVHILAGVCWVGAVFLFVFFIQPSAAAIAPTGAPFMGELLGRRHLVDWILTLAAITIVAGLFLYWHHWERAGSLGDWISTSYGAILTVGMVAAIAAMGIGAFGTRPGVGRLLALGREVAASGAPPTPEVAAEMGALQGRLKVLARVSFALLLVAVLAMSTARYW